MTVNLQSIGVIGAGSWGTALAQTIIRAGRDVTLWTRDVNVAASLRSGRENTHYLPGIPLDPKLIITADLNDLATCDVWLIATPAQHVRELCGKLAALAPVRPRPVVLTSKGIELNTGLLLGDVVAETLPGHPVAILSGPSFAKEVAHGQATALTLAMKDQTTGAALAQALATPAFRLYLTDDVVGAQIGGAVKNVLAIACGITAGRAMGENARAALITRGLAEIIRFGVAVGGRAETLMGLSGVGDLVLTCSSAQSRNTSLGYALGRGEKLASILAARSGVTEGVTTASAALALAAKHGIDMPIIKAVDAILNRGASIDQMIAELLARPLKTETA